MGRGILFGYVNPELEVGTQGHVSYPKGNEGRIHHEVQLIMQKTKRRPGWSVDLGWGNKVVIPASKCQEWRVIPVLTGHRARKEHMDQQSSATQGSGARVVDNEMQKIVFQWPKETKFQNLCQLKPGWVRNGVTNKIMTLRDELEDLKKNGFPEEGWVGTLHMTAMCSRERTRIRKRFQIVLQGSYRADHEIAGLSPQAMLGALSRSNYNGRALRSLLWCLWSSSTFKKQNTTSQSHSHRQHPALPPQSPFSFMEASFSDRSPKTG